MKAPGSWRLSASDLASHGERPALTGAAPPLSYRELHDRALALADTLAESGIAAGQRVAILSRSRRHDEPVALAAILLAGAVAVPLDSSSPPRRLAAVLEGRDCRAILHDAAASAPALDACSAAQAEARVILIELDAEGQLSGRQGPARAGDAGPTDPAADHRGDEACILHTSGSTGQPKPVALSWAGLDAFTSWMIALTRLGPGERVLRCAELVFDLSWFDHLASWRSGATLCTMARRDLATGRGLAKRLAELEPTVIYGVPALFTKLLSALPADATLDPRLHTICFAGEIFPPRQLRDLAERAPTARLYNLFGPTETNVCTYHLVDRSQLDGQRELPIGVACPYADCSLVDEDGAVIHGEGVGELVVAGPSALAGRFATGDRVERRGDGLFYFRGRLDRMVKIRGFRIEPAEIEAQLMSHPAVQEAAATVRDDPRLGKTLVAFAAPPPGQPAPTDPDLRAYLRDRLAAYMIPVRVHILEALPRTTTGKVDYRALAD